MKHLSIIEVKFVDFLTLSTTPAPTWWPKLFPDMVKSNASKTYPQIGLLVEAGKSHRGSKVSKTLYSEAS